MITELETHCDFRHLKAAPPSLYAMCCIFLLDDFSEHDHLFFRFYVSFLQHPLRIANPPRAEVQFSTTQIFHVFRGYQALIQTCQFQYYNFAWKSIYLSSVVINPWSKPANFNLLILQFGLTRHCCADHIEFPQTSAQSFITDDDGF